MVINRNREEKKTRNVQVGPQTLSYLSTKWKKKLEIEEKQITLSQIEKEI